jgi:hypothetical protein
LFVDFQKRANQIEKSDRIETDLSCSENFPCDIVWPLKNKVTQDDRLEGEGESRLARFALPLLDSALVSSYLVREVGMLAVEEPSGEICESCRRQDQVANVVSNFW